MNCAGYPSSCLFPQHTFLLHWHSSSFAVSFTPPLRVGKAFLVRAYVCLSVSNATLHILIFSPWMPNGYLTWHSHTLTPTCTHTHLTTHKSSIAAGLTGTPTRSKVALADCGTFQGRFKCLLGTLLCVSFNFLGLSLVGTHFYFQHRQLMAQNCSTYCCLPLLLSLPLSLFISVCVWPLSSTYFSLFSPQPPLRLNS